MTSAEIDGSGTSPWMATLATGWCISLWYPIFIVAFALVIRAMLSFVHAFERTKGSTQGLLRTAIVLFGGVSSPNARDKKFEPDYWQPFLLGLLELGCYPILIVTGAWAVIGAWLALKTVSQWKSLV